MTWLYDFIGIKKIIHEITKLGRLSLTFLSFIIDKRARTVFKNIFNRTFQVHDPSYQQ